MVKKLMAILAGATLAGCSLFGGGTAPGSSASDTSPTDAAAAAPAKPAVGAGQILGAFLGTDLGAQIDRADQTLAEKAAQKAYVAPIGDPVRWTNPANGHSGAITATRDGFTINGAYCREYQQTINVAERSHQAFGTACRQPTGTWKIVN